MRLKITFAAGAVAFLLTWIATAALGHAALQSSDPASGATIKTPYTLTATFNDELSTEGSSLSVQNDDGDEVATGAVSPTDDKTMVAALPALPDGEYEALWTAVTSDDGGVTRGTFKFNVSASGTAASAGPTQVPTPAPSAASGSTTGGGNDVLIALILTVVIIAGVVGFVLYRNRR